MFNAHDSTVLGDSSQRTLDRDQIRFTEKNADGGTTLYSMAEFQPKRDEAIGRRYILRVHRAKQYLKDRRPRRADPDFDDIWCVFDKDAHPNLAQAINWRLVDRLRNVPEAVLA